jgi:hypothetical protein
MSNANFVNLEASADYLGNGAIEINMYEDEIFDIVRRTSIALQRFSQIPATGHPHRYFEQTAIATAAFNDPRNISPTPTGPTRVERPAFIKCISNQTNITLFDKEVTQQQNQFAYVVAKDIDDILSSVQVLRAQAVWNGNDTSLSTPTTQQYVGLLTQITLQATIAPGASIIDGLKAQVASMFANQTYKVKPTAVYVNPILGDYMDREAKAQNITFGSSEVIAGVKVKTLSTQAGDLPIIADPYMPIATGSQYGFSAPPSGNQNYFAVIVTEEDIEMPFISGQTQDQNPRLFQLGLLGNLTGQYVGVKFDCVIAKGASYAHSVVCVQRP